MNVHYNFSIKFSINFLIINNRITLKEKVTNSFKCVHTKFLLPRDKNLMISGDNKLLCSFET